MDNSIQIKSISQLSGMKFFIPDYQRGYRWSQKQAEQLLEDIREFYKMNHEKGEFYCLQPIVVKKLADKEYEVIDGQQRLTTLFIILKTMENFISFANSEFEMYSLRYETRPDSEEFLNKIGLDDSRRNDCVDFYHMYKVYDTIITWFKNQGKNATQSDMLNSLIKVDESEENGVIIDKANNVRVIWYEIADVESTSTIDIFTRLNIGKIPLTNSELIKALILKRDNFKPNEVTLKQIQIAAEWNMMEQKLQNDSFWYFIYNTTNPIKYDNRIEYIFDLMSKRTEDNEFYHTFNWFSNEFASVGNDIDKLWQQVRNYFQTLDEWFDDRELYHYLGYLIEYGENIHSLKEASDKYDKTDFLNASIKTKIKKLMSGVNLDDLEYGSKEVRKVLLLFNILTVLETKKSDMRFPFNKFKTGNWDIEHICSQTDNFPSTEKDMHQWANDILEYFTETSEVTDVMDYIENCEEEESVKSFLNEVLTWKQTEKTSPDAFKALFEKAQTEILEDTQVHEKNHISNLALLDAETNRSYGNAFYPIKRQYIIKNDKRGIFVPIVTKNVFLKFYSTKVNDMMHWTESDADAYFKAMKEKLSEYLPSNK